MDANPDNFLFSGRSPDSAEWNRFLVRFHDHYPRATSDVFCQLADEHGRMSYDVVAERATRGLPEQGRLLEVGCGEGELLMQIDALRPGVALNGIDLVETAINVARARLPGADLVVGDASRMPWGDSSFDVVLSHMVLPYVYDCAAILAEARRTLSPAGRFVFALPDSQASTFSSVLSDALAHVRRVHDGYGISLKIDERLVDAARTPELLAACGFRLEHEECVTFGAVCDRNLLIDYIRRTYPLGLLDDVILAEVVDRVVSRAPARLEITLRLLCGSAA